MPKLNSDTIATILVIIVAILMYIAFGKDAMKKNKGVKK